MWIVRLLYLIKRTITFSTNEIQVSSISNGVAAYFFQAQNTNGTSFEFKANHDAWNSTGTTKFSMYRVVSVLSGNGETSFQELQLWKKSSYKSCLVQRGALCRINCYVFIIIYSYFWRKLFRRWNSVGCFKFK